MFNVSEFYSENILNNKLQTILEFKEAFRKSFENIENEVRDFTADEVRNLYRELFDKFRNIEFSLDPNGTFISNV